MLSKFLFSKESEDVICILKLLCAIILYKKTMSKVLFTVMPQNFFKTEINICIQHAWVI